MSTAAGTKPDREAGIEDLARGLAEHDDRLSNCVHCGFCLPACPTYVRLGDEADSPRGRLHLMRGVVEGRLNPASEAFQRHIDRCLGCRACETVCPSGVEYGFLLERAREVAGRTRRPPVAGRALLGLVERPGLFRASMGVGRLLRWSGVASVLARIVPGRGPLGRMRLAVGMLAASRPWRPPADGAAAPVDSVRWGAAESDPEPRGRAAVLTGCVQDHLFRRVNEATVRVLQANGWEVVEAPGQGCCGALHAHAGRLGEARRKARANVRAFRAAGVERIVVNAAGCGATMREYTHLMEGDDGNEEARADARWFSERVRDVSEVLVGGEGREGPRVGGELALRVAYDPPCHLLHGQRVRSEPVDLLRSIPGLEVVDVPRGEECCGGAGIYGITHPELGGRIGGDKADAVIGTGADVLATGNPGCAMQIGAFLGFKGSRMRVAHPVELLDESYRRSGLYEQHGRPDVNTVQGKEDA